MSYFVNNTLRLVRELRDESLAGLPDRLWSIARPKLLNLVEEVGHKTGLGSLVARSYRGHGISLMFHEIQNDVDTELRTGCSAAQLASAIEALKATGRDIVTIDESLARLQDLSSRPFALLTFDDGYRDNVSNALPVLEKYNAPMTLFVPTGMVDRTLKAWWLALRHMIQTSDTFEVPGMNKQFETQDLASKTGAMRSVTGWIGSSQSRADHILECFAQSGWAMAQLVARYAMDADELREFAEHPLVTIGAHTQTHRFLSNLDADTVHSELAGNKAFLEELLQRPIRYFAYPYGSEGACGQREADIAKAVGFEASFTTRPGHIFTEHQENLHLLPRIDVGYAPQSSAALASRLSGLHRAMTTGLGSPVATLA
ncbi:polysaccharide deacetylase family protein [uncultured Roseibium sp.]|uniref:polysaccharide deacetylase family protein n=1 Tax=uncultured Roseibium sp. TaxID=1936171 RepID=UPI002598758F|nr:polysaccharide deacetylase family protein [uncultured Roseibium sp.]